MNLAVKLRVSRLFVLIASLTFLSIEMCFAQKNDERLDYKRLAVIAGLQFHNFSLPLKDVGSNFTHPGLFIGAEVAYNKKGTLLQRATMGGYLNREIGDGVYINTQLVFRPKIYRSFYGELKMGAGYLHVGHPVQSYSYANGQWEKTRRGKSQLDFPIDFGFGYSFTTVRGEMSPFITYQINPALFYNQVLPFTVYTNFLVGVRVKPYK